MPAMEGLVTVSQSEIEGVMDTAKYVEVEVFDDSLTY